MVVIERFDVLRQGAVFREWRQIVEIKEGGVSYVVAQFVGLTSDFTEEEQFVDVERVGAFGII